MMKKQNKKPVKISILLPANAKFLSGIREFTMNFIKNMTDMSQLWANRFQSIVDELCTNAMEYGSGPDKDISLTLIYKPQKSFEVIVEDTGTGKIKRKATELKKNFQEETNKIKEIRGRGLSKIVKSWTDEMHFIDRPEGGIKVHVIKKISPSKN